MESIDAVMETSENNSSLSSGESSLYALAVIIDDLRSDDLQERLSGISRLPTISLAIGPERTRKELLTFLMEALHDEDEALYSIAKQMGNFFTYIGGPEYVGSLIPILEYIISIEEGLCRDEAVNSLKRLIEQLNEDLVVRHIWTLIQKVIDSDHFTTRSSICSIFPCTYKKLTTQLDIRRELEKSFINLCGDNMSIVRRSAAYQFYDFFSLIERERVSFFIKPFINLLNDDQDTVRVACVESVPSVLEMTSCLSQEKLIVVEELRNIFTDKSWRIRYKVAEVLPRIQRVMENEYGVSVLLPTFCNLLRDDEPEVRANAVFNLVEYIESLISPQKQDLIISNIIPVVKELVEDINIKVKSTVASVLLKLAFYIDRDKTIEHIIPLFTNMLKDASAEVRMNVVSNLGNINDIVEPEEMSRSLMPTLVYLSSDPKWRVRLSVIGYAPYLAKEFGQKFFDEKMSNISVDWLLDKVYTVRQEAGKTLCALMGLFGLEWAQKYVVPRLYEISNSHNYLIRLTFLFSLNMMLESEAGRNVASLYLNRVQALSEDQVPNVRFNVVKTLQNMSRYMNKDTIIKEIIPKIEFLLADKDKDVQYYSTKGLSELKTLVNSL